MSDPFLAEIRIFANSYAPRSWATCDGQKLPISQNTALYSIIGVMFGGNGTSDFMLPNFQGRVAVGQGQGPGLTQRNIGDAGGEPTHLLTTQEMASHQHNLMAKPATANRPNPGTDTSIARVNPGTISAFQTSATSLTPMSGNIVGSAGGGAAHNNIQPFQTFIFAIALAGMYPIRP